LPNSAEGDHLHEQSQCFQGPVGVEPTCGGHQQKRYPAQLQASLVYVVAVVVAVVVGHCRRPNLACLVHRQNPETPPSRQTELRKVPLVVVVTTATVMDAVG
jgi:hypothetical protein